MVLSGRNVSLYNPCALGWATGFSSSYRLLWVFTTATRLHIGSNQPYTLLVYEDFSPMDKAPGEYS